MKSKFKQLHMITDNDKSHVELIQDRSNHIQFVDEEPIVYAKLHCRGMYEPCVFYFKYSHNIGDVKVLASTNKKKPTILNSWIKHTNGRPTELVISTLPDFNSKISDAVFDCNNIYVALENTTRVTVTMIPRFPKG